IPQHVHEYDHTSFLAKGAMYVWEDGVPKGRLDAPQGILIKAGVKHLFQTIEDDTVLLCIHNLHGEGMVKVLAEHELESSHAAWPDSRRGRVASWRHLRRQRGVGCGKR